jgi:2,4-dienoyl-CoA reductase-like NADH-dependent reductase (Old Yellow Enzyme family)
VSLLLQPITIGSLKLRNRIFLAPLTRCRASGEDHRTPNALMVEYYRQRSTAGLILTEATSVTPQGVGYPNTPGIWSNAHVTGWKAITDAVHDAGGTILLQLWHVGRVSHPMYLNGELPVAPSAIAPDGHVSIVRPKTPYVTPRALETHELPGIVQAYRQGAENAKRAGFDGVEIHGANGYLLDQFLQDRTNHRTDHYGGNLENRARLMLEVTDAVLSVWGPDRVGMHLAPRGDAASMGDSNREVTFCYVAEELSKRKLAFICTREYEAADSVSPEMRKLFSGAFIGNEKFTRESAEAALRRGDLDAVAFGRDFLANPDLVRRFDLARELNAPVPETFYSSASQGYTDYPFLSDHAT